MPSLNKLHSSDLLQNFLIQNQEPSRIQVDVSPGAQGQASPNEAACQQKDQTLNFNSTSY